jgi:Fe2+ or Zn2+ uptake regulation protein
MTAATLAIRDQLLAVLRDAEGFPLSTREVCDKAGPMAWPPDAVTWRHLDALAAAGRVERVKVAGFRTVYWRAAA